MSLFVSCSKKSNSKITLYNIKAYESDERADVIKIGDSYGFIIKDTAFLNPDNSSKIIIYIPSIQEVIQCEEEFKNLLNQGEKGFRLTHISHFGYFRQYFGYLTENDLKVIYVNGSNTQGDSYNDYKEKDMFAYGGGDAYWSYECLKSDEKKPLVRNFHYNPSY